MSHAKIRKKVLYSSHDRGGHSKKPKGRFKRSPTSLNQHPDTRYAVRRTMQLLETKTLTGYFYVK